MTDALQPPSPFRPDVRSEWLLNPAVTFLNHGSFGAVPRCVLEEQNKWRMRIEVDPVELLARRGQELLGEVKRAVGASFGMREEDFGFVTNATEGVNAVLRSIKWQPGDELLTTTHVYNAVRQAMKYAAGIWGASYREIDVPPPINSREQILNCVLAGLSAQTRLLVIDHVTSPTALIFPVEQIVAACTQRGVDVLVDGAHTPGMLPLHVERLGAAYYAGNLHKWSFAPKGCGFLWARQDRKDRVHPLVISHHLGEGFAREFGWQGTRDLAAYLAVPRALQFMADLGRQRVTDHNHAMAVWVQRLLCREWGVEPIGPLDGQLLGSMAAVALQPPLGALSDTEAQQLQQRLYTEHRIEVPIMQWGGRSLLRPCCQVYNRPEDYERLAKVVSQLAFAKD